MRLRPERPGHVWAYGFVQDRTRGGRVLRMLVAVDGFTRECLAIRVGRRLGSEEVLEVLAGLFVERGAPERVRSDDGPGFAAGAARGWLARLGVAAPFIGPGSPWEDGCCESFNGKLRDELLDREVFYSMREAEVLIERWRRHYCLASQHPSGYAVESGSVF